MTKLELNIQSLQNELLEYKDKPYKCLFEYIWNSFDAGASKINLNFTSPHEGIGYVTDIIISDNGKGWDFSNTNTSTFLASSKSESKEKNKSLPMGHYGRGRYAFIWIAEKIEISSKNQKITLTHSSEIEDPVTINEVEGTRINFIGPYPTFSDSMSSNDVLCNQLLIEFGWFLTQNPKYSIALNGVEINENLIIKEEFNLTKNDLPEEIQDEIEDNINIRIVLWAEKPSEFSKFYFLDENGNEIYKENTGLNKKNDNFWHSVYITSPLFTKTLLSKDDDNLQQKTFDFGDKQKVRLQKEIKTFIKTYLTNIIRKPYLKEQSEFLLNDLKEDNLLPELADFGIYDEDSYEDLIKTIYTICPSLFSGKNDSEKRFICATFAGLLSNQDEVLIKKLLEQLQDLTAEEQKDLLDILNRTSLSSIVKTIKEIDHRLEVLNALEILISEHEQETLEVKHIQKILDENFWLFGEQFRLFSSTEGALKNVLVKYAQEILNIEDPELTTTPNGEVDLFLTKTESLGDYTKNIIVEIKRASIKLNKNREYSQIDAYKDKILEQNLCNGVNQFWEFYLIGKDYDNGIAELIESAQNHGERQRGLTINSKDGRVKVYVRKWSDILIVEWGTKMKYLKEKLEIQAKQKKSSPDAIVNDIINH